MIKTRLFKLFTTNPIKEVFNFYAKIHLRNYNKDIKL